MKAVRWTTGEKPGLELHEEAMPEPGPYEVVVKVHAASLNFRDQAILEGAYGGPTKPNGVPLSDGAGEVIAVGRAVTRARVGDRVTASCCQHWIGGPTRPEYHANSLGMTTDGWLAEAILLHENAIVHLPDYLSYAEAASLPCAAVTAWTGLNLSSPLQAGETVLVQGTGGVALFSLQVAKMFGAKVLAITSSDEKAKVLKALGAADVVNYRTHPRWDKEILALTGGQGVDKTIDIAGEKTIVQSAAATRIGGDISLVGFTSGFGGGLPPIDILAKSLRVAGTSIGSRASFESLLRAMALHEMHPVLDRVFPFADYQAAYHRLKSGEHVGKVVIDVAH